MSKNIVFYVTRTYMKRNKKRTLTTFAGILLMVLLMTCVFVGKDTGIEYLETVAAGKDGKWHASVYGISKNQYQELKGLPYVKETAGSAALGCTEFLGSGNPDRPYLNVKGYTGDCFDWTNISLEEGRLPENEQELVISRSALEDGAMLKLGDTVEAEFFHRSVTGIQEDGGKTYFPFFQIEVSSGETVDVPENFPYYGSNDSFLENREYTGEKQTYQVVGIIKTPAYEDLAAAGYTALTVLTEEQLLGRSEFNLSMIFDQKLLTDSYAVSLREMMEGQELEFNDLLLGFSGDSSNETINRMVKYMSILFVALIMAVSVALIDNVFQMSFRERSRYLGMLCSVGATGRQKRSSIFYEAFYLLLFALPLGILSGIVVVWAAVTGVRPLITQFMGLGFGADTAAVSLKVSWENLAAVGALSIVTVLISAWRPARMMGKIGPIESIRGNEGTKNRRYPTNFRAIKVLGPEGMVAGNTLKRRGRKLRGTARAAAVFLILLAVTSFGSRTLHTVMEKKMGNSGMGANPKTYDYTLYYMPYADFDTEGMFETLKEEIRQDPGVAQVREWRDGMFAGQVDWTVYSEEYWQANYELFNGYHHGTLSREAFEKEWRDDKKTVNFLSVDQETFQEIAKAAGADLESLKENSAVVLNEGEFSTDNVGIGEMEPDRYRYYHVEPMTRLRPGEEFSVSFYSEEKEGDVKKSFHTAALADTKVLEPYVKGMGDYYIWIITGPQAGEGITRLTLGADGCPHVSPYLLISLNGEETDLIQRLAQLSKGGDGGFALMEAGYLENVEQAVMVIADGLLVCFVLLTSLICLLNLFNSIQSWIQESAREYGVLQAVGMTKVQMKKMVLFQCGGIFLRSILMTAAGTVLLVFLIYRGSTLIFGNLILPLPIGLFLLAAVLVAVLLAAFAVRSLKKELKKELFSGIRGENLL